MCSKGGGSPPVPSAASTTFNSTTQPAASVSPQYTDFLNRAQTLSTTPFNPAQLGTVAPMNAEQTQAGEQMFNLGMDMGDWGKTLGDFDASKVAAIQSPFIQNVVGSTQDWFNNQNAIQGNDLLSQAIKSGNAFGGDRAGVAEGIMAGQQQLAQAPVIAGLYQSGYTQALDEYNKLKQFEVTGRQMGLQGAGAAMGWGGLQQQQAQKELDVGQQNAMMQSAYPFQTLNWYGSILGGIGPLLGQTAFGSNNPPEQSGLGSALGIGSAAVGLGTAALGIGGAGPTPAPQASSTSVGAKRGGIIRAPRRARGGLVPVIVRHNGGIIAGLAYGGPAGYDEDTSGGDDQDEASKSKQRDYVDTPTEATTPQNTQGARRISVPNIYGQLKLGPHTTPQPVFPNTSGSTQPQQSTTQQIGSALDLGTKALSFGSKLAPLLMFDRGGGVPHLENGGGGDPDVQVLSDAGPDPVLGGQQYVRDYGGRTTWFNPRNEQGGYTYRDDSGQNWTDTGAQALREGKHASGLPSTTPGFATPGSADLRNWFEVTGPDGKKTYAQKTDIGPPGVVDLNAPLAAQMYGRPGAIPSGKTQVRDLGPDQPAGAGGTPWPDPSKGNTGVTELPSGQQPSTPGWQVPGARQGRGPVAAGPTEERGDPRGGTGPVGTRIPGAPPRTFAQNLAGNPFWQLGTALMAKPGIKGREGSAIGSALQSMSAQQIEQRKADVLEHKPEMLNTSNGIMFRYQDGTIVPTGLKSEHAGDTEFARKTQRPFEVTEETPGEYGGTKTTKKSYRYDEHGNMVPVEMTPQQQGAPAGQRQRVIEPDQAQPSMPPPDVQRPAPAQRPPAPASPQSAPQVRQTQAPSTATGTIAGDLQRPLEERLAAAESAAAAPAPAGPAGATGGAAQPPTPQIAQAQPQQPAMAGPGKETGEAAWAKHIMPASTVTNPEALEAGRNPAALEGMSPANVRTVKAVADYAQDPFKLYPGQKNTGVRNDLINKVREYDSSYNPANLPARARALIEYGVNGKAVQSLQSNAMVLEHFGDAMTAIDNLGNSTVPIYNQITGKWQQEAGNAKYQAALAALQASGHAAATEAAKTLRGPGSMSQRETELWSQILLGKPGEVITASPVSMRSAVKELTGLVAGRLHATAEGYNQIMGPQYYRDAESWMTPKARETFERARAIDPQQNTPFPPSQFGETRRGPAGGGPAQGSGGQQPQQQAAPAQVQSMDDVRRLQPGTRFIIPDGSGRIGTVPQPRQ